MPTEDFIKIVVNACTGQSDVANFAIASVDGASLSAHGVQATAQACLENGEFAQNWQDFRLGSPSLKTLLLMGLKGQSKLDKLWVLDGWSLVRTRCEAADLSGVNLVGADLRGARLAGALLSDADLRRADMEKADLTNTDLKGACLIGCSLFSATLQRADCTEADLSRTDLRHADMRSAICVRTAFNGADAWSAYMWDVDLSLAFTNGADFERADYLNKHADVKHR